MPEDTAITAQPVTIPDGANDLGVELTAEQEAAFVDAQLGAQPTIKTSFGGTNDGTRKPADEPVNQEKQPGGEAAKNADEKPKDPNESGAATPAPAKAPDVVAPEPKPVEIPNVQTDDLWVEVEGLTVDAEGNPQPKTFKITLDGGLPDDIRFKNDKQLYETMDAMREMRDLLSTRQKEHDDAVKAQDEANQSEASRNSTLANWQAEDDQLVEAGLLDAPKAPPANGKEYTAEEIAADPALRLRDDIYKFMVSENDKRQAEGKSKIGSFATAFNLYQKNQTADADAQAKIEQEAKDKAEAELVKQRGALVGGGSPAANSSDKGYVYKAGSAKSIWAVDTSDL